MTAINSTLPLMWTVGPQQASEKLGISLSEGQALVRSYYKAYPRIPEFIEKARTQAKKHGFVTTLLGRRRFIVSGMMDLREIRHTWEYSDAVHSLLLFGSPTSFHNSLLSGLKQKGKRSTQSFRAPRQTSSKWLCSGKCHYQHTFPCSHSNGHLDGWSTLVLSQLLFVLQCSESYR